MLEIVHDEGKLRELGGEMGNIYGAFMLKEITADNINEVDASAFGSKCAESVLHVRADMQRDGYSAHEIDIYLDACIARMKEMFSAYRAASGQRSRN